MKRVFLSFVCFGAFALAASAQDGNKYDRGIGIRLSSGFYDLASVSYKTFVTTHGAIELNLGVNPHTYTRANGRVRWATVNFSAAYQHHFPIQPVPGLQWYIGGGLSAYNSFSNEDNYRGFGLGIFPTGGVDYKIGNIPLNVSADFRPTFSLVDPYNGGNYYGWKYRSFDVGNVGVSARYTF